MFGFWLPGQPTVIDQIMSDSGWEDYYKILNKIDMIFEQTGKINLESAVRFLQIFIIQQLSIIQNNFSASGNYIYASYL